MKNGTPNTPPSKCLGGVHSPHPPSKSIPEFESAKNSSKESSTKQSSTVMVIALRVVQFVKVFNVQLFANHIFLNLIGCFKSVLSSDWIL